MRVSERSQNDSTLDITQFKRDLMKFIELFKQDFGLTLVYEITAAFAIL